MCGWSSNLLLYISLSDRSFLCLVHKFTERYHFRIRIRMNETVARSEHQRQFQTGWGKVCVLMQGM